MKANDMKKAKDMLDQENRKLREEVLDTRQMANKFTTPKKMLELESRI